MKGASRSTKIEKGDSDMAKKKVAEEKSNTRMTTQQLLKQSGSPDVPHSMDLLDRPRLNKGTAFTDEERSKLGLHGLLPPHVESVDEQVVRAYEAYKRKDADLERHVYLRALQDNNEVLFYRLLLDHTPMVYTPMVRQPLLLGRLFPRQRDRTRPRLSTPQWSPGWSRRIRSSDARGRASIPHTGGRNRELPSGLRRPKHKGASRHSLVMRHRRRQ